MYTIFRASGCNYHITEVRKVPLQNSGESLRMQVPKVHFLKVEPTKGHSNKE